MKHVLFALFVAACTSDPASALTPHNCARPALVAPVAAPTTLEIRKHGVVLAHLAIAHGTVGTLTLAIDSADARELRDRWHRIETGEQRVQMKMHETTPEGGRGALATRFYQPNADDYASGVRLWLTWEQADGYDVK
jgi:hypothetical protein